MCAEENTARLSSAPLWRKLPWPSTDMVPRARPSTTRTHPDFSAESGATLSEASSCAVEPGSSSAHERSVLVGSASWTARGKRSWVARQGTLRRSRPKAAGGNRRERRNGMGFPIFVPSRKAMCDDWIDSNDTI